jgi:hypothetical protein
VIFYFLPNLSATNRPSISTQPAGKVANEAEPTGPGSTLATLDFSARQLSTYAHHQLAQGLYRVRFVPL